MRNISIINTKMLRNFTGFALLLLLTVSETYGGTYGQIINSKTDIISDNDKTESNKKENYPETFDEEKSEKSDDTVLEESFSKIIRPAKYSYISTNISPGLRTQKAAYIIKASENIAYSEHPNEKNGQQPENYSEEKNVVVLNNDPKIILAEEAVLPENSLQIRNISNEELLSALESADNGGDDEETTLGDDRESALEVVRSLINQDDFSKPTETEKYHKADDEAQRSADFKIVVKDIPNTQSTVEAYKEENDAEIQPESYTTTSPTHDLPSATPSIFQPQNKNILRFNHSYSARPKSNYIFGKSYGVYQNFKNHPSILHQASESYVSQPKHELIRHTIHWPPAKRPRSNNFNGQPRTIPYWEYHPSHNYMNRREYRSNQDQTRDSWRNQGQVAKIENLKSNADKSLPHNKGEEATEVIEHKLNGAEGESEDLKKGDKEAQHKKSSDGSAFEEHEKANKGEKGENKYNKDGKFEKAEKGHHDKEGHSGVYHEEKGHAKKQNKGEKFYEEHEKEQKGKKGKKYGGGKHHKKGHITKGEHNIVKKNEFIKSTKFYDEDHDDGGHKEHGEYYGHHSEKEGAKKSGGHDKSEFSKKENGKKGHHDKGSEEEEHTGHDHKEGHEEHKGHEESFSKKAGGKTSKTWKNK